MLIEKVKLVAKKVNLEERDFLGKDGTTKIKRKVLNVMCFDPSGDVIKLTSFDPAFEVPKEGKEFVLPPVKRLECFDGMIQNVMV